MCAQEVSVYPQAKPFGEGDLEAFLAQPLIAKLCTHNEDGTIHIVPIWFKYADGNILLGTQEVTRKVRNIKRDGRVTVLVDGVEPTLQGAVIYGTARLQYDDVIPARVSIFEKYVGPEQAPELAKNLAGTWTPVIIRIEPERIITFDYSKGFGISQDPDATAEDIF